MGLRWTKNYEELGAKSNKQLPVLGHDSPIVARRVDAVGRSERVFHLNECDGVRATAEGRVYLLGTAARQLGVHLSRRQRCRRGRYLYARPWEPKNRRVTE